MKNKTDNYVIIGTFTVIYARISDNWPGVFFDKSLSILTPNKGLVVGWHKTDPKFLFSSYTNPF